MDPAARRLIVQAHEADAQQAKIQEHIALARTIPPFELVHLNGSAIAEPVNDAKQLKLTFMGVGSPRAYIVHLDREWLRGQVANLDALTAAQNGPGDPDAIATPADDEAAA